MNRSRLIISLASILGVVLLLLAIGRIATLSKDAALVEIAIVDVTDGLSEAAALASLQHVAQNFEVAVTLKPVPDDRAISPEKYLVRNTATSNRGIIALEDEDGRIYYLVVDKDGDTLAVSLFQAR